MAKLANRMVLMDHGRIVMDNEPDIILSDMEIRSLYGFRRMTNESQMKWESLIRIKERDKNGRKPRLTLDNVSAGYNRRSVIRDIHFSVYPGDFIALVGNNGVGKSTLGLVSAGLLKPHSGSISFLDGAKPRPGLDVAMLFQNPVDQLFTDSVDDEVGFGPRNYDLFDIDQHEEILRETDLFALKDHRPLMLSVGQEQRTALGACLGLRPKLLILDEPTLGQDWWHLQKLMDFLKKLNQQGMAILLISHDYKIVHRYAHRVYLMKNGQIQLTGQSEDYLTNHQQFHSQAEGVVSEAYYS